MKIDDEVSIETVPLKLGKNVAFFDVVLKNQNGEVVAKGNTVSKAVPRTSADIL